MAECNKQIKSLGTHEGTFHADDVMAVTIIKTIYPLVSVVRSREDRLLAALDMRVDVGMKYNPATYDFDHHQHLAEIRANGIPYAASGLVWKHFGRKLSESEESFNYVDLRLIQAIDAEDNGLRPPRKIPQYSLGDTIKSLNALKNGFSKALELSRTVLEMTLQEGDKYTTHVSDIKSGEQKNDGEILVLNKSLDDLCTWDYYIVPHTNAKYIVYPHSGGNWRVRAVPVEIGSFESRLSLPSSWRGKSKADFQNVSGVKGAEFCHKTGFMLIAQEKESAIKLAEIALQSKNK